MRLATRVPHAFVQNISDKISRARGIAGTSLRTHYNLQKFIENLASEVDLASSPSTNTSRTAFRLWQWQSDCTSTTSTTLSFFQGFFSCLEAGLHVEYGLNLSMLKYTCIICTSYPRAPHITSLFLWTACEHCRCWFNRGSAQQQSQSDMRLS